jgi:hypothetical protein
MIETSIITLFDTVKRFMKRRRMYENQGRKLTTEATESTFN